MLIKNSERISYGQASDSGLRVPIRFEITGIQAKLSIVLINNFRRKVFGFQRFEVTFSLCPSVVPDACGLLEKLEFPSIDLENRWESVPLQPSSVPTY
jgi:hypothetical protein